MKRIISLVLLLLCLVALFPGSAFGEEPVLSGECGKKLKWSFDEASGVLLVTGKGKMADYEESEEGTTAPWAALSIQRVDLASGVTSIGKYAFAGCSMEEVTIPDTVTEIGKFAFFSCGALQEVAIPAGVSSIGKAAFSDCGSLKAIQVDAHNLSFRSIDGVLFTRDRYKLLNYPAGRGESYAIPSGTYYIRAYAFYGSEELSRVDIPTSVISIGEGAFAYCRNLLDVYYAGSRSQWKQIEIDTDEFIGYDALLSAAVYHAH